MPTLIDNLRQRLAGRRAEAAAAEDAASAAAASAAERYADLVTALAKDTKPPRGLTKPEAVEELLAELGNSHRDLERDVAELAAALARGAAHDAAGYATRARLLAKRRELEQEASAAEKRARELRLKALTGDYGHDLPGSQKALADARALLPFIPSGQERLAYLEARAKVEKAAADLSQAHHIGTVLPGVELVPADVAEARLSAAVEECQAAWAAVLPLARFAPQDERGLPQLPSPMSLY